MDNVENIAWMNYQKVCKEILNKKIKDTYIVGAPIHINPRSTLGMTIIKKRNCVITLELQTVNRRNRNQNWNPYN